MWIGWGFVWPLVFVGQAGSPAFGWAITGKCLEEGYCVLRWSLTLQHGEDR